jgi:hypothetical protein
LNICPKFSRTLGEGFEKTGAGFLVDVFDDFEQLLLRLHEIVVLAWRKLWRSSSSSNSWMASRLTGPMAFEALAQFGDHGFHEGPVRSVFAVAIGENGCRRAGFGFRVLRLHRGFATVSPSGARRQGAAAAGLALGFDGEAEGVDVLLEGGKLDAVAFAAGVHVVFDAQFELGRLDFLAAGLFAKAVDFLARLRGFPVLPRARIRHGGRGRTESSSIALGGFELAFGLFDGSDEVLVFFSRTGDPRAMRVGSRGGGVRSTRQVRRAAGPSA